MQARHLHRVRGRGGVPVRGRIVIAAALAALAHGCDSGSAPLSPEGPATADRARQEARGAMTAVVKAAATSTSSCVAGELHWEADEALPESVGGEGSRYVIPEITHYSRPCIPERCSPKPADLDALRSSARALETLVDANADLRVPSFQGFVAMADAMVGFADSARGGPMSGLSMHYAALAAALRAVVPDVDVPAHPPSLVASLAVPEPGGDPCKGWRIPKFCDVRGVRVPKEIRWRTDPPCIEVESIRK
jgi:hypothetical protein